MKYLKKCIYQLNVFCTHMQIVSYQEIINISASPGQTADCVHCLPPLLGSIFHGY